MSSTVRDTSQHTDVDGQTVASPPPAPELSRRRFLASAGALGAGALVAAPGGRSSALAAPAAQEQVEITIHVGAAGIKEEATSDRPGEGKFGNYWAVEVYSTYLEQFMAENPDIKVTVDWFPGRPFSEKILAKKAAGQLKDIVHGLGIPLDMAAKNEIYRPLDELIEAANFDLGQYFPEVINALRFDPATGKRGDGAPLYALPTSVSPGAVILYYNAEMFAQKGIAPPTSDMSWDDLLQTAIQMTERQEGAEVADVYGWLVSPFWFREVTDSWLRDFGADMIDETGAKALLNTEEAKAAFRFIYDAIYEHKVSPRPDQLDAMGGYKNMFLQQKVAMYRLPPFGVLATSAMPLEGEEGYFEWGAVAMPKGPSGVRGTSLAPSFIGMTPYSEHPEEAFKVLAWVTNKEAGVLECFVAAMCGARPDVREDERVKQSPLLGVVNPLVPEARQPRYAANGRDAEAFDAMAIELDKLLNDQVKPDDAFFDNMNEAVQEVLDKPAS